MTKPYFLRLSAKEQISFTKRLGILINSGLPIVQALKMIQKQAHSRASSYIFGQIVEEVESGQTLSNSMLKFKKVFGGFAVNVIKLGELSGNLNQNLDFLAENLRKKQELRRKIIGALVYPAFIGAATIGISILLISYAFPKILPIFQSFKASLPWSTRMLIFLSSIFINYSVYLGAGLILLGAGIVVLFKLPAVALRWHKVILRLPILGPLFQSYYVASFSRQLGMLIKSDIRIVEGFKIVSQVLDNLAYRNSVLEISEKIAKGEKISKAMKNFPVLFPAQVTDIVAVGESTGKLSSTLLFLAEIYEDDLNNQTQNLSTAIEPVLMIFMGLLVGFIAISIITPIYSITQNLHP